jgi:hypothetical protein
MRRPFIGLSALGPVSPLADPGRRAYASGLAWRRHGWGGGALE